MKNLKVDGVEYIKASEVAKQYGYTSDYIGQLCRSEKIEARLIGRSWYVDPSSLVQHKKDRYRSNQKKTSQIVKSDLQDLKKSAPQASPQPHFYNHVGYVKEPVYQHDETDLIPDLKKITVVSTEEPQPEERVLAVAETSEVHEEYAVSVELSEQPKSGALTVKEACESAESAPDEVTTMVAVQTVAKKQKQPESKVRPPNLPPKSTLQTKPVTFAERVEQATPKVHSEPVPQAPARAPRQSITIQFLVPVSTALVVALVLGGFLIASSWQYTAVSSGEVVSGLQLNLSSVFFSNIP